MTALNAVAARQTRAGRGRPPRVPPAVGGAGKKRGRKKGRVGGGGGSGDGGDNDDDEGTDGSGNGDESRGGDQEPGDGDGGGGENEHGHGHGGGQESPPAGTASERGNNSRGGDRFADGDANGSRGQEPGAGDERDGGNSPAGTNDDGGGNDDGGADGGTNEDGDRNRDQEPLDGDEDGGDGIGGVEDGNEAGNDNGDGGGIDNERENDPGDSGINDDDDADNTPDRQPSESPGPRDNDGDENQQHTQPDLTPDPIQQQPAARDSDLEHGAAGSDPASSIREDNQNPSTPKRQSAGTQQPSASPPTPPESQSRHHQPTCEDLGPDDEVNAPSPKSPIQRPLPGPIGLPTPPTSARRQQLPSADTPLTSNPPADSSLGPNHSPPPPESTMSRALVPAPPEHIRRQLQIAASSPTPAVSPTTQQAAHVHRRNGRPTVQLQSATHRLVNDSTSGSASNHRVVGQTVINHAVRNLPDGPLRLGAPHIDDSALSYTLNQISNLPDILTLSPRHKETLGRFVLSFFAPDSWWTLRNIMCKVVASTGFRNTERLEPNQPTTEPGSEKPQCVQDYIESWHQQRVVCQKTADPAITTMLKMNNEMQLYIYWCRLQRVWLTTRDDRDRDHAVQEDSSSSNSNDCLGGEEANISSEQEAELIKFFDHEVEQRERSLGKAIRIRSVALLKSLIAPYLGYSFPLEAEATAGRGSATKKMFQTLWSKSNVRGKEYYILRRNLGWGAFAIAKTS